MTSIERILLPVDFSEACRPAVEFAESLARKFSASLVLLHAFEPPTTSVPSGIFDSPREALADSSRAVAERQLAAFREQIDARDVAVESVLVEQAPTQAILDYARRHEVDLIVLGSHGHTALRDLLLGGVAEKIIHQAPCPVLVVRTKQPYRPSEPPEPGTRS